MGKIMNKRGVLDLAKELVEKHPDTLQDSDSYFLHLADSYDNARELVEGAHVQYPGLHKKLDKREIALAAGLHDIGRPFEKDQLFHELKGRRYIQGRGLELGVADNRTGVYRISQMFTPHFVVSEQWGIEENEEKRKQFEPLDSRLLIPRTWQEAIVIYSELTNVNGEQVSYEERIEDIQKRYNPGTKYADSNPSLVKAMNKGLDKVFEVCEKVQRLKDGKLKEEEISQYGFI